VFVFETGYPFKSIAVLWKDLYCSLGMDLDCNFFEGVYPV
jgi:hypothetical protein